MPEQNSNSKYIKEMRESICKLDEEMKELSEKYERKRRRKTVLEGKLSEMEIEDVEGNCYYCLSSNRERHYYKVVKKVSGATVRILKVSLRDGGTADISSKEMDIRTLQQSDTFDKIEISTFQDAFNMAMATLNKAQETEQ